MPTYEYACESCGARYEKKEGFDAKARQKCQQCGNATAQRVLFAPPIVFKGSGFYKNDARGAETSDVPASATPAAPDLGTAGHGHTHGPGGHTHDTPAPAAADVKPEKKAKKDTTTPESAAAS